MSRTTLEPEEAAYPNGGLKRKGCAILRRNPSNPIDLPYGEIVPVLAGIPDTYFSIPAAIRHKGKRVRGFLMLEDGELEFTPDAAT